MKDFFNGRLAIGIMLGIFISIFLFNFFNLRNHISNMSIEFVSSIAGALVGGFIALFAQFIAVRAQNNESARIRLDKEKTLYTALFVKLMQVVSNLKKISDHVEEAQRDSEPGAPLFSSFRPIANDFEK